MFSPFQDTRSLKVSITSVKKAFQSQAFPDRNPGLRRSCRRAVLPAPTQTVQAANRDSQTWVMKVCTVMTELFKQRSWQEAELYKSDARTTTRPEEELRTTQT